ncbi:MAG: divalent-cation tolerance protein CutA [Deltaproteobacteria bacterium]|nr:divalent-cation tolerance protein CutA [Deltaproteobacteria bacterium]
MSPSDPSVQSPVQIMLCTAPDMDVARALARRVVEERLAACVNLVPELRSIYHWEGEIREEGEVLMVIKTVQDKVEFLTRTLVEAHPYEVPEVVAFNVRGGSEDYLDWIMKEVAQ